MKKNKKYNSSFAEDYRRKQEILDHGKLISLRPSQPHKSKKLYSRKTKHKQKGFNS